MNNICNEKYSLFPLVSVIFLILFTVVYLKRFKKDMVNNISFGMVILGGVLNNIEWLSNGCVLDNIKMLNISYLNINDLLITGGLGILLVKLVYEKH